MFEKLKAKRDAASEENNKSNVDLDQYLALESELRELKKEHGIEEKEGRISRLISSFFDRRENRVKRALSKKKYIVLLLLTGWFGGHRFYARHYKVALLYLVTFWCGFPMAMSFVDLLIVVPMKPDENGNILL